MAAETKFTPGPWKAERLGREIEIGAETPLGHLSVAWIHLGEAPTPREVSDGLADAAILAAAPDLYSALERLVGCVNGLGKHPVRDLDEAMEEARHALAHSSGTGKRKARGSRSPEGTEGER